MAKYRIINHDTHYTIERRSWFGIWFTLTEEIHPYVEQSVQFATFDKAYKEIESIKQSRRIAWEGEIDD